jgi:membrane-bound serine protease (ClpP class)
MKDLHPMTRFRSEFFAFHLLALLAGALVALASDRAAAENAIGDEAAFVNVPNPITSEGVARIKNRIEASRANVNRPLRKVVFDFNPDGKDAATSDYGACYQLAEYIGSLHDLGTIGYVSHSVTGHTVLPVLACKEIAMAKEGSLGEILASGEPIKESVATAYRETLGKSREAFGAVVRKMLDRGVSLGRGEKNGVPFYVDLREIEILKKQGVKVPDPNPLPFGGAGTEGKFPADRLKSLGLVATTADSRKDLVELYSLSPNSLRDDPLAGQTPVAFKLVLQGPIDGGLRETIKRTVDDVAARKGNVLFIELRSSGGDISAARDIADHLIQVQKEKSILIVAFVPEAAPDTAAIVALGCGEIVMSKRKDAKAGAEASEAVFGDFEGVLGSDAARRDLLKKNLTELAGQQGYPVLLLQGMIDRDLAVVSVHHKVDRSRRRLMTEEEFQTNKADWVSTGTVKPKGQLLRLSATRAAELGIARFTVDGTDVKEVYSLYGVEAGKVREATPGWLDRFATYLRLPAVTVLLVVIGFAGLILEIKVPGVTVPGIIAALCFILVFWSHSQYSGQTAILGGLIFLLGLVLLLVEIFVIPGFGVTGLLGILFLLGGVGLATFDRIPDTMEDWTQFGGRITMYVGAMAAGMAVAFFIARFLPQIPFANRMVLTPPADDPNANPIADLPGAAAAAALLGAIGTTATQLRPAGMAQFGEQYVDVITEGGFINSGVRVQVVEVEGTRIVVKEV